MALTVVGSCDLPGVLKLFLLNQALHIIGCGQRNPKTDLGVRRLVRQLYVQLIKFQHDFGVVTRGKKQL